MTDYPQFDKPDHGLIYARGRTWATKIVGEKLVDYGPDLGGPQTVGITQVTPESEHSQPLFITEEALCDNTGMTPQGVRAVYGQPIPAGVVCDHEAWPMPQVEHIDTAYLHPVVSRLHLQHFADSLDDLEYLARRGDPKMASYTSPHYPRDSGPLNASSANADA